MNKIWLKILTFCIVVFAFSTACNEEGNVNPESTNAVVGYFISEEGTPISDAIVEATDGDGNLFSSSTTNNLGSFEVTNIPEITENALVSFVKDGTIIKQIKLNTLLGIAKKSGKADVFLNEEYDYNAVFAIKVTDDSTLEVIEGAYVCLSTSENAKFEATTDATGYAYLPEIVPGRYSIYIAHNDYKPYNESLLLLFPEGMDTLKFTFPLTLKSNTDTSGGNNDSLGYNDTCCNNIIKIQVLQATNLDSSGAVPFANCKVTLMNVFKKEIIEKNTDYNGWVEFTDLCNGHYTINVSEDGYFMAGEFQHRVSCNDVIEGKIFVFKKCCDNVIIVHYKDKNGNPINCGKASLYAQGGFNKQVDVINGTATFNELCNYAKYYFSTTINGCNIKYPAEKLTSGNTDDPGTTFSCKDTLEWELTMLELYYGDTCCDGKIEMCLLTTSPNGDTLIIDDAQSQITFWKDGNIHKIQPRFVNGLYIADGLCPGQYTVRIEYNGVTKEEIFDVICNDYFKKIINF
ncbi:MAG: carboxypeptidase-like regulatory domain-containing protein [Bacteroidetes bacterium]|nr:carboxypeptidase-like regulatory domain-containing protein [Bacteroidota bacterium]